jgi:meiosis-specific serine/threonine-protein kinase MEK1
MSTNGVILNGYKIRKASVILMDGDTIEIPASQSNVLLIRICPFSELTLGNVSVHMRARILKERPEKENLFDPTPSSQVSYRVQWALLDGSRLES